MFAARSRRSPSGRRTRGRRWRAGSPAASRAAIALLGATWLIAGVSGASGFAVQTHLPPFDVGNLGDVAHIVERNLLVLALHAMACVAGFIAGSSLPLQAQDRRGLSRLIHERGGRIAIGFVVAGDDLLADARRRSCSAARRRPSRARLRTSPGVLLVVLLPHALIELTALFLPLAAWIIASRRGDWDQLLAATVVTVAIALPMLVVAALIEVYISPHVMHALVG